MLALLAAPEAAGGARVVADHPEPTPTAGEVLIAVRCAGICATDLEITRGYLHFDGILGHEFVGTVVAGAPAWIGQRVVAEINCGCGTCAWCAAGRANHCPRRTVLGIAGRDGAFAERVCVPAANCHAVPEAISDRAAAFVEPLAAAAHVLDVPAVMGAAQVAVLGSGRLGLLVAQVLAARGVPVQVLGRNPRTLKFCEERGIATRVLAEAPRQPAYDVLVECTGHPQGFELALTLAQPGGTIVLKSTYAERPPMDLAPLVIHELQVVGSRCGDFEVALRLLAEQAVDVEPLVDAEYSLRDGLAALRAAGDAACTKVLIRPTSA